jgi:hypothetical protein
LNPPGKYKRIRRNNGAQSHNGKRIDVIYGVKDDGKTEIQALRYPKGSWSASEARSHCGGRGGRFEAAASESETIFTREEQIESLMIDVYDRDAAESIVDHIF